MHPKQLKLSIKPLQSRVNVFLNDSVNVKPSIKPRTAVTDGTPFVQTCFSFVELLKLYHLPRPHKETLCLC